MLIHIIGAVCLLLWGTRMVRNGFSRAYGTSLRRAVSTGSGNRLLAFAAGIFTTTILQSSTAAILIVSGFVKKATMGTATALAVIIGADLGTAIISRILSLDLNMLSPALLAMGIITYMNFERSGRVRHIARALIGIGLILLALSLIREAAAPLKESDVLPLLLQPLAKEPALAIIFAALLTWTLHSSLASILLFAAMVQHDVFSPLLGLYLVLGANIGGALVPMGATMGDGLRVRRVLLGNLLMRMLTVVACFAFVPLALEMLVGLPFTAGHELVSFHVLFNLVLAALFLPLTGLLANALELLLPETDQNRDPAAPLYLDEKSLKTPVIALACAARETLRMAEIIESMLAQTITAFKDRDERIIETIENMDNIADRLNQEIKIYLTRLSRESFDPKEADRYIQILTFATNLENCGDIIDKNLMELARKKLRTEGNFSKEGFAEIESFHASVLENLKLAQTIFLSEDPDLAAQLVGKKRTVREAEVESSRQHFNRLREGMAESIATSSLHLDIIRDLRRINSYITSVAYTIIDNHEKYKTQRRRTKIPPRLNGPDEDS
jgi:phosphate:Na+ symporter